MTFTNPAKIAAQKAANANVDLQQAQAMQQAGAAQTERWNSAALLKARRRAGGSTYRRRGTVMGGASSLDKANIAQTAAAQRKAALAGVDQQFAQQAQQAPLSNGVQLVYQS